MGIGKPFTPPLTVGDSDSSNETVTNNNPNKGETKMSETKNDTPVIDGSSMTNAEIIGKINENLAKENPGASVHINYTINAPSVNMADDGDKKGGFGSCLWKNVVKPVTVVGTIAFGAFALYTNRAAVFKYIKSIDFKSVLTKSWTFLKETGVEFGKFAVKVAKRIVEITCLDKAANWVINKAKSFWGKVFGKKTQSTEAAAQPA